MTVDRPSSTDIFSGAALGKKQVDKFGAMGKSVHTAQQALDVDREMTQHFARTSHRTPSPSKEVHLKETHLQEVHHRCTIEKHTACCVECVQPSSLIGVPTASVELAC